MGYIRTFENPYPFQSCISDSFGWRVEFSGSCRPGVLEMGRHLVVFAGVNRSDGLWQTGGSGTLTITPLRTTGENTEVFTLDVPGQSSNPGENKSWFIPGMISYTLLTDGEPDRAQQWISGGSTQIDIPRMQVNWGVEWTGSGPSPTVHFFDRGQKFIIAAGVPVNGVGSADFNPGTLIMQPKNISWQPISVTISENWRTAGVLSCSELDRVGWLNNLGQYVSHDSEISGGICPP